MKRIVVIAVWLLSMGLHWFGAQELKNCKVPEFHGLRLGMTYRQVMTSIPFLKMSPKDKYGIRDGFKYITTDETEKKRLPRVFSIEVYFLDDRLVKYVIAYDGSTKPAAIDNFILRVAAANDLPIATDLPSRTCRCNGASVSVGADFKRSVSVCDRDAEPLLDKRVEDSYRTPKDKKGS